MRYYKLVLESKYIDNLKDDIINMLSMAKSRGIDKIKTQMLIRDLKDIGYEIDKEPLVSLLNDIDIVSSSDDNFIQINGFETDDTNDDEDDLEIPKLDQEPLDDMDLETENDPIDKIARKRSVGDL